MQRVVSEVDDVKVDEAGRDTIWVFVENEVMEDSLLRGGNGRKVEVVSGKLL